MNRRSLKESNEGLKIIAREEVFGISEIGLIDQSAGEVMNIFFNTRIRARISKLPGLLKTATLIPILGLAILATGWNKSDTLGVAVGVGQQVAPKILDAKQTSKQKKATEVKRPADEKRCIENIMLNPDSAFEYINDYAQEHGVDKTDDVLSAIRYTEFGSESDAIPLYKEEIYSGSSYPFIQYVNGCGTERKRAENLNIAGEAFLPAIVLQGGSNYPAFTFFFLGNAQKDVESSRSTCALFGVAQTFPPGTEAKDVGLRAKQKYGANFTMESSNVAVKRNAKLLPFSYSYSRSTLILTNNEYIVKLVCNDSNSLNIVKMDRENFRTAFFNDPDIRMQLQLQIGMGYDEIKSFIDNSDNQYKMGYDEINAFYTGLNKGCESSYNEEMPEEMMRDISCEAGRVTMQVFDAHLITCYRNALMAAENERREAVRVAEEKAAAENEAQRKKALEF